MAWRHRDDRYGEKLATPDTSVGDLIGDVDPVKVAEGRTLGDPETIHFGLVPRTNRGIFSLNELPDLAERIQVSLLNVLEERDIGSPRLRAAAAARPAAGGQRQPGGLHQPRPDHHPAQGPVRRRDPHPLPADADRRARPGPAGGRALDRPRELPDHLVEVIARFTRLVRESPAVDARSGVSARFAIAAAETRGRVRGAPGGADRRAETPVARVCDLPAVVSTLRGKVEFEVSEEGREKEVLAHLLRRAIAETFRSRLGSADLSGLLAKFDDGGTVETGDLVPATDLLQRVGDVPGLARIMARLGMDGRRVLRARGGGGGVRPGGAVPDAPPVQGHRRRHQRVRDLGALMSPCRTTGTAATHDGPDPLAPPFDVRGAVDELGDAILAGANPADALRDLLRRGSVTGPDGAASTTCCAGSGNGSARSAAAAGSTASSSRPARCSTRRSGRSAPSCSPTRPTTPGCARPSSTRCPPTRPRRSGSWPTTTGARPPPAQTFEQLKDLLRREVLDSQFRGMKQALQNPDPEAMQRVKDMLGDLNEMLDADARGEHTQADFDQFMERYGDMFPDHPQNLEELVDSLVRRMAAAERLLRSLSDEQREELAQLMANALEDAGLAAEMARLADALRARRPELDRAGMSGGVQMSGDEPLGLGDATTALAELADLAELETALGQDYPGASLDDVDEEAVRRALGRQAVDDIEALRRIERELERQGYLTRNARPARAHPQGRAPARGHGAAPDLRRPELAAGHGDHDLRDAGAGGRADRHHPRLGVRRRAAARRRPHRAERAAARRPSAPRARRCSWRRRDFEVAETERRSAAVVSLLVDLSYSMQLRGTWARGQADRARAARAAAQPVPAGRHPGHRLLQLRA